MPWHPDMARIIKAVETAPSIFNQRPWDVRLSDDRDRVELYANPGRAAGKFLPREVVISCGAALYNLRLTIRVAGRTPSVWLLPGLDGESPLLDHLESGRVLLASVEVMPGRATPARSGAQDLYEAMWLRHTNREPYLLLPVPTPILVAMENAAYAEHGSLRILHRRQCSQILRSAARAGDRLAGAAPIDSGQVIPPPGEQLLEEFRAARGELNKVPRGTYGPRPVGEDEPPIRRDFWLPGRTAIFEKHPQLMALSTEDDRPLDWLRAGQALQHALLTATRFSMSPPNGGSGRYRVSLKYGTWGPSRSRLLVPAGYGVTASFLSQSLELADLTGCPRRWPWHWYYPEVPQLVLRVGFAPMEPVHPPWRPLEVIETRPVPLGEEGQQTG